MGYIIGIDEAGLGPVFGPMVVAGIRIEKKYISELKKYGVKDSKLFNSGTARQKRIEIWNRIETLVNKYSYRKIPAEKIDNCLTKGINMYEIEIKAIDTILEELDCKTADTIYIAQLGMLSIENLLKKLKVADILKQKKLIYEKDADSKFLPVSAASILAKIIRDNEVNKLCRRCGYPYVNGYPNKKTELFIKDFFNKYKLLPYGIRKTRNWEPLKKILYLTKT